MTGEPLLFLSHAGIDGDAALRLAERIELAGVKVWIDKRDLQPGRGWREQLEDAIVNRSTAFAVYIGRRGAVNWVEAEIDIALSRAIQRGPYPFIPIVCAGQDISALPHFARRYQGVGDVDNDHEQFRRLINAARGVAAEVARSYEPHPFVGLKSFSTESAHLFFGRETETDELVDRLRRTSLLMLVGDSGSGKSSLVKAGIVPKFRGGVLSDRSSDRPDKTFWHVIETRPLRQPFENLVVAVIDAARELGIDSGTRGTIADWIRTKRPEKLCDALREGAPRPASTLLVLDQFEELWTQSPADERTTFVEAILALAAQDSFACRVVVSMRADYYNLCSAFPAFHSRIEAREGDGAQPAKFFVKRMTDDALRKCIVEPLKLTRDGGTRAALLADEVIKDASDQAGNLALVEVALDAAWRDRAKHGGDLVNAYVAVGRTAGALAREAENAFEAKRADGVPEATLAALFIRLVRLGDTGGTTRRIASRSEFTEDSWALAQDLAREESGRLLTVGSDTVELTHEAAATQWGRYQSWLETAAADKRVLDVLIDDARRWDRAAVHEKDQVLATGLDLAAYGELAAKEDRAAWLAPRERAFVAASEEAENRRRDEENRTTRWLRILSRVTATVAVVALGATAVASWFWWDSRGKAVQLTEQTRQLQKQNVDLKEQRDASAAATSAALNNESRALTALAETAIFEHRYVDAAKLALAAWPRHRDDPRPRLSKTLDALAKAGAAPWPRVEIRHPGLRSVAIGVDERLVLSWGSDGTIRLWDASTGQPVGAVMHHDGPDSIVFGAQFDRDQARILSWGSDRTVRLWDASSGRSVGAPMRHEGSVSGAQFDRDQARILSWGSDGTVRLWGASSGRPLGAVMRHE